MENVFRITGPLWGESNGDRWIPVTTRSVGLFFDVNMNKLLKNRDAGELSVNDLLIDSI